MAGQTYGGGDASTEYTQTSMDGGYATQADSNGNENTILLRRDREKAWETENPKLGAGEIGLVIDKTYFKVGDGTSHWNDLQKYDFDVQIEQGTGTKEDAVMSQKAVTDAITALNPNLFKGILYAYLTDGKYRLYTKYDSKNTAENMEFTSNYVGGEPGSVWRVKGGAGGILISNYGTLSLITPRNMYLFEYSDSDGNKLESSSEDYKNGNGYWRKVTQCENLTTDERTKWNKVVTDLAAEIQNRKDAIADLDPKLFDGTIYIDTNNSANILYKDYNDNDASFSNKLGYQTNGKVFKVTNKNSFSGIGISIGGKILVLSAKRNLYFTYDDNKYIFDKEYNYVTATDISTWNKAVTDLATVKGDITDLKNNPSSASTVEYATSVFSYTNGFVFADGASFLADKNEVWLSTAMRELGLNHKSVAVGGQSIKDTAYRLCKGTEYKDEELEKMDVFLIDHVHNQDVFTLSRERSIEEYEEIIRNLNIDAYGKVSDYSISYAEAFDYVIKKHMANCYNLKDNADSKWHGVKSGKPVQMLLCTHWHDARTTYNESVRKLCAKWGIALCEMDINIGFAKTGTHPVAVYNGEPAQISLFYAQDGSKGYGLGALEDSDIDKQVTPYIYGLHQYLGEENHNYLTHKMASILMRCFTIIKNATNT